MLLGTPSPRLPRSGEAREIFSGSNGVAPSTSARGRAKIGATRNCPEPWLPSIASMSTLTVTLVEDDAPIRAEFAAMIGACLLYTSDAADE